MNEPIINLKLINQVLRLLVERANFKRESISYEVQDDANHLLISIVIDQFPSREQSLFFRHVGGLLNELIPKRRGDYSWMVTFKKDGEVVDAYFGGDLDSPDSGL